MNTNKLKAIAYAMATAIFVGVISVVTYWLAMLVLPILIIFAVAAIVFFLTLDGPIHQENKREFKDRQL